MILAIMILPFIAVDLARCVQDRAAGAKEAAYGVGCTTLGSDAPHRRCPIPASALVGGVMLALGRALGETMAVTFVIGNAHQISPVAVRSGHHHRRDHRQ